MRGGSGGAASATSSPSLEVQQILHTQNGKLEEYTDDDDDISGVPLRVELAEEDGNVGDHEEEEEEPEALQNHHRPHLDTASGSKKIVDASERQSSSADSSVASDLSKLFSNSKAGKVTPTGLPPPLMDA